MEVEKDGNLVFLDINVQRDGTNNIQTKWHIKGTNTGTYLNKSAFSPHSHKSAAIRSLIYRAYRLSSKPAFFEAAYEPIRCIFINNGYH